MGPQKRNCEVSRGRQVGKEVEARIGGQGHCKLCLIICLRLAPGMKSKEDNRKTWHSAAHFRYRLLLLLLPLSPFSGLRQTHL